MSIIDLTDAIENMIDDGTERMIVTTHLMAADRIHTSVCASYPLLSVDRNLNLGESNAPRAVLETFNKINKLQLSEDVRQNLQVLRNSVAFYQRTLQQ